MNTRFAFFACAAMASTASAGTVNLLENPGFETGELGPWFQDRDFGGSDDFFASTFEPHSGAWSAEDFGNKELRQNFAPTPTVDITEVSFWARHREATAGGDMAYTLFYEDGSFEENIVRTTSTDWQFFDVTSELDAGRELIGFSVFGNINLRFNFDDAVIAVVPAPGAAAIFAGAGLLCARRRRD